MFEVGVIAVSIYLFLFHIYTTASSEQNWYWIGANAIKKAASSEDTEVPEFVWGWYTVETKSHKI
jgi:hypothetical protein